VFLLSVQLTYLYQLLGCKGPYLSSTNAGGYNVRQDDGVTAGEAPLTSYVYSSGCLWWRAGFMFQDFLSSDFLPLLWFISGIGDMDESVQSCGCKATSQ